MDPATLCMGINTWSYPGKLCRARGRTKELWSGSPGSYPSPDTDSSISDEHGTNYSTRGRAE